ncbi:regulatory protein RecX [Microbacterium sp. AG1240]|uniref:regulatory protein RecX n=1 Tax=Microbacterium sp. AG1240 TaxID=2183992 RepID=UPI00217DB3B4|nr:regulatory protein RecX [Microbacterium sp. AG1240]
MAPEPKAQRPSEGRRPADVSTDDGASGAEAVDPGEVRDAAEASLLRKLHTRQLSVSESRGVLLAAGMTGGAADELLDQFERLGYLDDLSLSQQLVRAAVERKGQGRQAISPLLTRRGIPRDVVDTVLSEMPDDDLERALDFARTKARSLGARDRETALRRLLGQLARRGYPSSVSMTAARQALDEL